MSYMRATKCATALMCEISAQRQLEFVDGLREGCFWSETSPARASLRKEQHIRDETGKEQTRWCLMQRKAMMEFRTEKRRNKQHNAKHKKAHNSSIDNKKKIQFSRWKSWTIKTMERPSERRRSWGRGWRNKMHVRGWGGETKARDGVEICGLKRRTAERLIQ